MRAKKTMYHLIAGPPGRTCSIVFACMAVDIVECLDEAKGRVTLPQSVLFEGCLLAGHAGHFFLHMTAYSLRDADVYNN